LDGIPGAAWRVLGTGVSLRQGNSFFASRLMDPRHSVTVGVFVSDLDFYLCSSMAGIVLFHVI
jgi:hypothetical protein